MQCGGTGYNHVVYISALSVFRVVTVISIQTVKAQVEIGYRNLQIGHYNTPAAVTQKGLSIVGDGDVDGHRGGRRLIIVILRRATGIRLRHGNCHGVTGGGACRAGSRNDQRVIARFADGEIQPTVRNFRVFPEIAAAEGVG